MTDEPIAYTKTGRPIFDNTPSVVSVATTTDEGILAMRRASALGYGKLCLPGGYHMRGEDWQTGGAREVMEETGYLVDPTRLTARHVLTDTYGNNMIFARNEGPCEKTDAALDGESLEVLFVPEGQMDPEDWAFPLHFAFAKRSLEEHRMFAGLRAFLETENTDGLGTDHRFLAMGLVSKLMEVDPDWRESVRACHHTSVETAEELQHEME